MKKGRERLYMEMLEMEIEVGVVTVYSVPRHRSMYFSICYFIEFYKNSIEWVGIPI